MYGMFQDCILPYGDLSLLFVQTIPSLLIAMHAALHIQLFDYHVVESAQGWIAKLVFILKST